MSSSGGSFGYFPDTRKLDDVLRRGQFTRALAIESPLKAAYAHGRECKIQWKPEVQLPVGIYFFEGIDEGSLVMQVGGGNPPGGAEVVDCVEPGRRAVVGRGDRPAGTFQHQ